MATARKLPSGKWRVRMYIKGHNPEYVSFTAKTKAAAEREAANYRDNWRHLSTAKNQTVGEAIDEYIESRSAVLSPATIRGYKHDRTRYFQGLMDINVKQLSQRDVQQAVNFEAKLHSPKTVRNMHGLLSSSLANSIPDLRLTTQLPANEKRIDSYDPNDDDVERLLAASSGRRLHKAIILGACVTMRRSEISALKVSDINTETCEITIQRAMVLNDERKWVIKGTKTYDSTRVAVVAKEVIEELLRTADTEEYLIGLKPDTITKQFCNLRNELGIRMRFHDLRGYSASVQHALGVPDKYIMRQGGWSTDHVMKKVYQKAMRKKAMEAAEVTNQHFSGLLNAAKMKKYDTKCDTDLLE